MPKRSMPPTAFAMAFAITACQPPAQEAVSSMAADIDAVKQVAESFDAAFAAGDPDGLAALYADDAIRMMPDLPAWVGHEAIRAGFASEAEQNAEDLASIEVDNVSADAVLFGDWATVRGTFTAVRTPADGGEPISVTGKWMALLNRQADGTWKVAWDIWNRDAPLPD